MFEELSKVLGENAYSVEEAAPVLALCPAKVRELIHSGKLKASRLGRRHLIRESAIREYVIGSKA